MDEKYHQASNLNHRYTFFPLQMLYNHSCPLNSASDLAQCPRIPHPPTHHYFYQRLSLICRLCRKCDLKKKSEMKREMKRKNVEKSVECEATKNGRASAAVSSPQNDKRTTVLLIPHESFSK